MKKVETATLSASDLAIFLETTPKRARRFLRRQFPSMSGQPGNWEINPEIMPELKAAWDLTHQKSPSLPATTPAGKTPVHKRVTLV